MENLIKITESHEIDNLCIYLEDKEFVAFDTETTSVDKGAEIIGMSICAESDIGYYIVLAYWDKVAQKLVYVDNKISVHNFVRRLIGKNIIMHNAVFDCAVIQDQFNINLMPSVHTDTLVLAHLLDENRSNGLKELGVSIFGKDANAEQLEMKESVVKNGGVLNKSRYELYKADVDLLARYGAKDAILTYNLFYYLIPQLYEEGLDKFFYEDESMPLLKGPTFEMNTVGMKVDTDAITQLHESLEAEIFSDTAFINKEIDKHIKDEYPGVSKKTTFNIFSPQQMAWLLFVKLNNHFNTLTKAGKDFCHKHSMPLPYKVSDKNTFLSACKLYAPDNYWKYFSTDKNTLEKFVDKYAWMKKFLSVKKNIKLLDTYVIGIQEKMKYGVIKPNFLQYGTTSGRYASNKPNFQNLPRDDKRIKSIIVSRPGSTFVGADFAQLEPRVFASVSGDETLMNCFSTGEDFYSVVGAPIFGKRECSLVKDDKNSFATLYPQLRNNSKVVALATPYGRTANQQAQAMGITIEESKEIIQNYFEAYPKVKQMMLDSHDQIKKYGVVHSLFGRPRRVPEAVFIEKRYGTTQHSNLPYEARTLLNLAMNHRVQSTAASIVNRSAIACWRTCQEISKHDDRWRCVKIVLQVHDELILECPLEIAEDVAIVLQNAMENTVELPGVKLEALPKIAKSLADLK